MGELMRLAGMFDQDAAGIEAADKAIGEDKKHLTGG